MRVDATIGADLDRAGSEAARLEVLGYDGIKVAELAHDPFLPLTLAAASTNRIELMTSVAVAFARNPMSMAHLAHDLNAFSKGRFILGLGTQVRPHVERRFAMPWYKGPAQMREFIDAMQAIFACWYDGEPLDFDGEYYRHDLMPRTFMPQNTEAGRPRILLSATGPLMTRVAAESADGLIMHPFSTERYIAEVNLPAVNAGLKKRGLARKDFQIDYAPMIATGQNEEDIDAAIAVVRDRIAFYGSTPGYRAVLELHGWGELQPELNRLMKQHRTQEMAALVTDEILETFAIVGEPLAVARVMVARLSGLVDRTGISVPRLPEVVLGEMLALLRS